LKKLNENQEKTHETGTKKKKQRNIKKTGVVFK
jgi:hypothetical protein